MCSPRCAAALGTYGLTSNHNIRTRWTRSSFDSNSLFARRDNFDDAVQVLRNARTAPRPPRNIWSEAGDMVRTVSLCGLLSMSPLLFFFLDVCAPFVSVNADAPIYSGRYWLAMDESNTSSIFTSSGSVDFNEHNIWNPVLELLFHVQVGHSWKHISMKSNLVRIALSCHFALDVLCDKVEVHCPDARSIRHYCL